MLQARFNFSGAGTTAACAATLFVGDAPRAVSGSDGARRAARTVGAARGAARARVRRVRAAAHAARARRGSGRGLRARPRRRARTAPSRAPTAPMATTRAAPTWTASPSRTRRGSARPPAPAPACAPDELRCARWSGGSARRSARCVRRRRRAPPDRSRRTRAAGSVRSSSPRDGRNTRTAREINAERRATLLALAMTGHAPAAGGAADGPAVRRLVGARGGALVGVRGGVRGGARGSARGGRRRLDAVLGRRRGRAVLLPSAHGREPLDAADGVLRAVVGRRAAVRVLVREEAGGSTTPTRA